MGLLLGLLTLPLAPARGVVWIADLMRDQAERELTSPEAISRRLAEVERAREDGEISAEESVELEERILDDLWWTDREGY